VWVIEFAQNMYNAFEAKPRNKTHKPNLRTSTCASRRWPLGKSTRTTTHAKSKRGWLFRAVTSTSSHRTTSNHNGRRWSSGWKQQQPWKDGKRYSRSSIWEIPWSAKGIHIIVDNTSTMYGLRKGSAHAHLLNTSVKQTLRLLPSTDIRISHITTDKNPADSLSRQRPLELRSVASACGLVEGGWLAKTALRVVPANRRHLTTKL
jgi:hypothetical protein